MSKFGQIPSVVEMKIIPYFISSFCFAQHRLLIAGQAFDVSFRPSKAGDCIGSTAQGRPTCVAPLVSGSEWEPVDVETCGCREHL